MDVNDLLSKMTFIIDEYNLIDTKNCKESEETKKLNEFINFLKKQKDVAMSNPTNLDVSLNEKVIVFHEMMTDVKNLREKHKILDNLKEIAKTPISKTKSTKGSSLTLIKNLEKYKHRETFMTSKKIREQLEKHNPVFQKWFSENASKEIDISFEVSINADKSKFVSISFGFVEIIFDPFTEEKIQMAMNWMNKIPEVIDQIIRFKDSPLIEEWFEIAEKNIKGSWTNHMLNCLIGICVEKFKDGFEKKEFLYTIDIIYSSMMSLIKNSEPCSNHKKSIPVIKTLSQKVSHVIDN